MKYSGLILVFLIVAFITSCDQEDTQAVQASAFAQVSGPYLGQDPPGMTPELFAPGIVSTGHDERCAAFSADGRELYYCLWGLPHGVILHTREVDGRWTKPVVATFSGGYPGEVSVSPRDGAIYFSSKMPFDQSSLSNAYWIWKVERTKDGFEMAEPLSAAVNSENFAGYPYVARSGDIYFFSDRSDGFGGNDIYFAEFSDGRYAKAKNIGAAINTELPEVDPCIAPDGSYLIFSRWDGVQFTTMDLYISFRTEDGSWTTAVNMGTTVNSDVPDFCPSISTDGKYLFFTSRRTREFSKTATPITYAEKIKILNSPGNGTTDIYWIDAKIIDELKTKTIK